MATKKTTERKTTIETTVDDAGKVPAEKPPVVAASVKVVETPPGGKKEPAVAVVAPSDPPKEATPSASKLSTPVETKSPKTTSNYAAWFPGLSLVMILIGLLLGLLILDNQYRLAKVISGIPSDAEIAAEVEVPACPTVSVPAGIAGTVWTSNECPEVVISDAKDWKRVVWDCAGRIWQDKLLPEGDGRIAYDVSFTSPVGGDAVFNGSNAVLLFDKDKNGVPEETVAANKNGVSIVLVKDGWYQVKNGTFNGGFEIKFSDPS